MVSAQRHYYLSGAIIKEPGGQGQAGESLSSGTWEAQNCRITEIADSQHLGRPGALDQPWAN